MDLNPCFGPTAAPVSVWPPILPETASPVPGDLATDPFAGLLAGMQVAILSPSVPAAPAVVAAGPPPSPELAAAVGKGTTPTRQASPTLPASSLPRPLLALTTGGTQNRSGSPQRTTTVVLPEDLTPVSNLPLATRLAPGGVSIPPETTPSAAAPVALPEPARTAIEPPPSPLPPSMPPPGPALQVSVPGAGPVPSRAPMPVREEEISPATSPTQALPGENLSASAVAAAPPARPSSAVAALAAAREREAAFRPSALVTATPLGQPRPAGEAPAVPEPRRAPAVSGTLVVAAASAPVPPEPLKPVTGPIPLPEMPTPPGPPPTQPPRRASRTMNPNQGAVPAVARPRPPLGELVTPSVDRLAVPVISLPATSEPLAEPATVTPPLPASPRERSEPVRWASTMESTPSGREQLPVLRPWPTAAVETTSRAVPMIQAGAYPLPEEVPLPVPVAAAPPLPPSPSDPGPALAPDRRTAVAVSAPPPEGEPTAPGPRPPLSQALPVAAAALTEVSAPDARAPAWNLPEPLRRPAPLAGSPGPVATPPLAPQARPAPGQPLYGGLPELAAQRPPTVVEQSWRGDWPQAEGRPPSLAVRAPQASGDWQTWSSGAQSDADAPAHPTGQQGLDMVSNSPATPVTLPPALARVTGAARFDPGLASDTDNGPSPSPPPARLVRPPALASPPPAPQSGMPTPTPPPEETAVGGAAPAAWPGEAGVPTPARAASRQRPDAAVAPPSLPPPGGRVLSSDRSERPPAPPPLLVATTSSPAPSLVLPVADTPSTPQPRRLGPAEDSPFPEMTPDLSTPADDNSQPPEALPREIASPLLPLALAGRAEAEPALRPAVTVPTAPASAEANLRELAVTVATRDLGPVTVEVREDEDQGVTASLVVDSPRVERTVRELEPQVRLALRQEGLALGGFDVSSREGQSGEHWPWSAPPAPARWRRPVTPRPPLPVASPRRPAVDIYA